MKWELFRFALVVMFSVCRAFFFSFPISQNLIFFQLFLLLWFFRNAEKTSIFGPRKVELLEGLSKVYELRIRTKNQGRYYHDNLNYATDISQKLDGVISSSDMVLLIIHHEVFRFVYKNTAFRLVLGSVNNMPDIIKIKLIRWPPELDKVVIELYKMWEDLDLFYWQKIDA